MNNNTEIIDAYLNNELSAADKVLFEKRIATDPELVKEIHIQKQIVNAVISSGLKLNLKKAIKQNLFQKLLLKIGLVLSIAALGTLALIYTNKKLNQSHNKTETSILADSIQKKNSLNSNTLPFEEFNIETETDNILESKDGFIFAIPANAFNTNEKKITLKIQTAINPYDIIRLGLSTTSNGALLKTAGMFNILGYANGQEVNLNKEVQVNVPTKEIDPNMQLFKGEKDSIGNINWVNPKPMARNLKTYDITKLNFYPKNYLPTLKLLNKAYKNKYYTDSLYFSFSGFGNKISELPDPELVITTNRDTFYFDTIPKKEYKKYNQNQEKYNKTNTQNTNNHIDPAIIQTIWNSNFNNTLLATKEFEERLQFLHTLCNNNYLNKYINNLDKALYEIDEELASLTSGEAKQQFLTFAKRKDGKVAVNSSLQQKLNAYFETKYLANKEATETTNQKYFAKIDAENEIANNKGVENNFLNQKINSKNYAMEYCANLTNAYRQIGVQKDCPENSTNNFQNLNSTNYNFSINTMGWYNVDAMVSYATTNRTSASFYDNATGKTASITYNVVKFQIENYANFNKVQVYLLPLNLNSYQKITDNTGNIYNEKLNALFKYDAVAIGYRNEQIFYAKMQNVTPSTHSLILKETSEENLKNILNTFSTEKSSDLEKEINFQLFQYNDLARQLKQNENAEFRIKVAKSIFACWEEQLPGIDDPNIIYGTLK
jgi:hypothetical protein